MNILFNLINQKLYYNFSKQNNTFINIGYGIDNNYARCCATSITSFCLNNPTKNFNFHIMAGMLKINVIAKKIRNLEGTFFDKQKQKIIGKIKVLNTAKNM